MFWFCTRLTVCFSTVLGFDFSERVEGNRVNQEIYTETKETFNVVDKRTRRQREDYTGNNSCDIVQGCQVPQPNEPSKHNHLTVIMNNF